MKPIVFSTFILLCLLHINNSTAQINKEYSGKEFTTSLMQDSCMFSTNGQNDFFILEPGYRLQWEGIHKKDTTRLLITVLNETRKIGNTETRVVEENESVNGKTIEISRNFFAFCKQTIGIYYVGEEVDIYKNGKIVSHEGAWVAEVANKPGLAMPGLQLLGSRYYQEIAPGLAMDRAEIISMNETMETPAGKFSNVLKILETTTMEPGDKSYKFYAPKIGLLKDGQLLLTKYGFITDQ
jgi:hypothetical protein